MKVELQKGHAGGGASVNAVGRKHGLCSGLQLGVLLELSAISLSDVNFFFSLAKSNSNTPGMQKTRRAHKERGRYAPQYIFLAACLSSRRAGWAVRRFNSRVLSEVPDVVLCLCVQGEGAFLRIAPQRYKSKEPLGKRHIWSLHLQQKHRGAKK